jgi:hypothetical protein
LLKFNRVAVAVKLFEIASGLKCLLVIDYLLALPTLPNQLIDAVYLYVVYGKHNVIKRRILDFVNQRGLVDEFADFMIDQCKVPVHSVWKTAFPRLRKRKKMGDLLVSSGDSVASPFSYAFNCVKDLTAALEIRFRDAFPANRSFIRADQLPLDYCSDANMIEAITNGSSCNTLTKCYRADSRVFMATSAVDKASRIFLLEFTKRQSSDPCFMRFNVGDDNVYHLQFFEYVF